MNTPPAYSLSSPIALPPPSSAGLNNPSLPAGAPKARHVYTQHRSSGNVIELRIESYAPNSASTPFFWTGSTISGTVSLTLPTSNGRSTPPPIKDQLKAVVVELRGVRTVSSSKGNSNDLGTGAYERPFLAIPITLFDSKTDEAVPVPYGSTYVWPFTFKLPETIAPQSKRGPVFRSPPTFNKSGFQEFTKYEIHTTIKKGLLKPDELLVQQLLVLPQSSPLKLQSRLLLAAFKHDLPVPLPFTDAASWRANKSDISFRNLDWEGEATVELYAPSHPYHARGTAIPLLVHIVVASARPLTGGSRAFDRDGKQAIYLEIRDSIEITLESLYPIGHNAGTSAGSIWVDDVPPNTNSFAFDRLPDPIEVNAEVLLETVATSCQLWSRQDRGGSSLEDEKRREMEEGIGGDGWLQGEIIPNANILPDFVFPSIRLSHVISLRLHASSALNIVSVTPAASNNARKVYATFASTPPVISLPTVITSHSLPGDATRSVAPVPAYR